MSDPNAQPPSASNLPPAVRAAIARARAWLASLSRPAKILIVTTLAAGALIAAVLGVRSTNDPYAVLFSNLDRDDASALVMKLKEMKVPYRISPDESAIEVPESRARELRMELASAGLPRGGGVGFEAFDKPRLGATEFEQRVMYRRALEGELARTIGAIAAVQTARVHLVAPEKSVFVSRSEPASASIVIRLRQGRALGAGEVAGIVHLVASSVSGLSPDRVALVTTDGVMLHRPRAPGEDGAPGNADRGTEARALEGQLEDRARAMLEKVVGPGHADVRVNVDMDLARLERTEDRYDPQKSALRSEEQSIVRGGAASDEEEDDTAAGVPGAGSNLGGAAKPAGSAGDKTALRESHTRNFEIDHVQEKRVVTSGTLRRLTVAVIVDGEKGEGGRVVGPRSKEELDKLAALVRSAVGAAQERGDVVTVESVPFFDSGDATPVVAPAAAPSILPAKYARWLPYAGAGAGVLVALALALAMRRRAKVTKKARELAAARATELGASPSAEELAAAVAAAGALPASASAATSQDPDALREEAHRRAATDPATAALVLRAWLGTVDAASDDKAAA